MLPTPAGKLLGDSWPKGSSDSRNNTWAYAPYIEHLNDLGVAAFLQERSTGRILQVALDYKDETVGLQDRVSSWKNLAIYPNPAKHMINVNLGSMTEHPGRIELMEMNGKTVLSEYLPAAYQVYQLDIGNLPPGMYILNWIESDRIRGVSKFVKMK